VFGLRKQLLALTLASAVVGRMDAQVTGQMMAPCPITVTAAGKGTIVGTVSDMSHNPLDSVEVYIASEHKQTLTDAKGFFKFEKIDGSRAYQVAVRRFGYNSITHQVVLGDNGATTSFCMPVQPRSLVPVISSATRVGLTGVVADTGFGVIPGAEIAVLGGGAKTYSDSAGRFAIDLKPGRYMVRVTRDQFASKMVSVTIPPDSGRQMLIWLAPSFRGSNAREAWDAHELALRLDTMNAARSRIWTREDLNNSPFTYLYDLAKIGALYYVDDNCMAVVDGRYSLPLWVLKTDEIEMAEVYQSKPIPYRPTSTNPGGRMPCPRVFAWLRKP
jgi:hypothetical protein